MSVETSMLRGTFVIIKTFWKIKFWKIHIHFDETLFCVSSAWFCEIRKPHLVHYIAGFYRFLTLDNHCHGYTLKNFLIKNWPKKLFEPLLTHSWSMQSWWFLQSQLCLHPEILTRYLGNNELYCCNECSNLFERIALFRKLRWVDSHCLWHTLNKVDE